MDHHAGKGLGASHQTGWTGLVANLIQKMGVKKQASELGIPEDSDEMLMMDSPQPDLDLTPS